MKNKRISGFLIYLLLLVVALLIYFNFVYVPISEKNTQMEQTHLQNTQQIQYFENMITQGNAMRKDITVLQEKLKSSEQKNSITSSKAADDVDTACKTAGITPSKVELQNPAAVAGKISSEKEQLYSVDVSIGTMCTVPQLQKLLDYFEKQSAGAYYVNQVQFTPSGKDASTVSVNLSLSLYYFGAAQQTATSSSSASK